MQKIYRQHDGISSGFLKALSSHPKEAKKILDGEEKETTEALSFGSLFDDKITQPKTVNKKYHVLSSSKPTDKLLEWANKYLELYQIYKEKTDIPTPDYLQLVLEARRLVKYNMSYKEDTALAKFKDGCSQYVDEMTHIIEGKKIPVTQEQNDLSNRLIDTMKRHPSTMFLFKEYKNKDIEILFQEPVYFKLKFHEDDPVLEGKALFDVIVIDHINRTIKGIDIKTYEGSFKRNFFLFKYYYQGSWYHTALIYYRNTVDRVKGYTIQPFEFIAIDKTEYRSPEIYTLPKTLTLKVLYGDDRDEFGESKFLGYKKSIVELLEEYKLRIKTNNWEDSYEMLVFGTDTIHKL